MALLTPNPLPVENGVWSLFPYTDKRVSTIIHGLKYEQKKDLAPILGGFLAESLDLIIGEDDAIIIPIPSAPKEYRTRGFDHVALLAEETLRAYHGPITLMTFRALKKIRETTPQVKTKNRSERLSNLVGAYERDGRLPLQGKTLILIDDITTTGATFTEAKRALKDSGAQKIVAIAIAH